jgi:hypothetical protein
VVGWENQQEEAHADSSVKNETLIPKLCQVKRNLFKGEDWPITPPPDFIAAADKTFSLGTSDPAKIKLVKLGWDKDILI